MEEPSTLPTAPRWRVRRPPRLRLPPLAALHPESPWWRRLRIVVFAVAGASLALALAGHVPAKVGPFETTISARPSLTGHTVVHLSPLGTIDLDTHDWPVVLDLRVDEIGVADAERIADNPKAVNRLGDEAARQVRSALVGLAVRCLVVAVVGGVLGALAARASWRSGLARAAAAVGDVESVLNRFGEYRAQLADLVDNVATLYLAGESLPTFEPGRTIRVLHVSDIHLNPAAFDLMRSLVDQFGVDVVADTGDLTDWGTDVEAPLVNQIGTLGVPYVYVRGNHDSRNTQAAVAAQPGAVVLDGNAATVAGLRFWGIGDPRYTPNKSEPVGGGSEQDQALAFAPDVADGLEADEPPPVDVAMVHDERMAADLGGVVPLVLAGHTHKVRVGTIEPRDRSAEGSERDDEAATTTASTTTGPGGDTETRLLVEGSTGGGGLRGLQGNEPVPLTASVLYFDPGTHRLLAYDAVTVSGLGETGATIERHVLDPGDARATGG
jgi:predicted phosphodiesterase